MKITVTLEQPDWNVVVTALGRGPYIEVARLIENIAKQVNEQTAPPKTEPDIHLVKSD